VVEDVVVKRHHWLGAVLLVGCGEARSASPKQQGSTASGAAMKAEFVVDTATVQIPLELPAQLYVEHDAVVVARSAGTIDSLYAELGDHVQSGQALARMESADQQIALARADASYENANKTLARARVLTKAGGTTAADLEQLEFQVRDADIARSKARRDVELTRIAAPFAGVVTSRVARPSRFVAVGDTLFRVTEAAPLYARVRVPEASARALHVGGPASIVSGSTEHGARIVHAAPIIDAASGTREIVVEVGQSTADVVPGSSVIVRLGRDARRVTTVPREAVAPEGYVVVVDNGRSTLRSVTVGRDIGGGRVEIVSGVSLGERLAKPTR
jgi:membrane fusion protein (multidrug efflux system)